MANEKILRTIKHSPLGETLSDTECWALADISEIKLLQNGDYLVIEGDEDKYLYVIVSGTLAVMKKMPIGGEEILCRLDKHELAGISGFVDQQKRLANLQAVGPTEVLAISRERFHGLIKTHPDTVYKVMCALVREALHIVKRLDDNIVELNDHFRKVSSLY